MNTNISGFKYWVPVFLWMSFIFWMSTGGFSGEKTSSIIVPIIKFIVHSISDERAYFIHGVIRKLGHVSEYFILGALVLRASCFGAIATLTRKQIFYSLLVVALYASSDELHQSFVATRTASIIDVGIDIAGGALAISIGAFWRLAVLCRERRSGHGNHQPGGLIGN
jgi:VanZ family protein